MQQPEIGDTPGTRDVIGRRTRTWLYCLGLGVLASLVVFHDLGADALSGDEAQYALCVRNIRRSGQWLTFSPYPPTIYLQKPPLYFWLTAATYNLFGHGTEASYRAWSAAFGVACIVLTCALGSALFAPEVGLLAGLLLLTNRALLLKHGIRAGTFDSAVMLFVTACVALYWLVLRGSGRWLAWMGIGVFVGLASLSKPLAGVPILAILAVHGLVADRSTTWRQRAGGPLAALLVAAAVAGPWYLAVWLKYRGLFVQDMFRSNLIERATVGIDRRHVRNTFFYLHEIVATSGPFALCVAALPFAAVAAFRSKRGRAYGLVATTALGWMVLFSLSVSKLIHYIYAVFPCVAIAIAAFGAALAHSATRAGRDETTRRRWVGAMFLAAVAALGSQCCRLVYRVLPQGRVVYPPWEMVKALQPAIDQGRVALVLHGFPDAPTEWRDRLTLKAQDCYYFELLAEKAQRSRELSELKTLLPPRRPALLAYARTADFAAADAALGLGARLDPQFIYEHRAVLLAGVDLDGLLRPRCTPSVSSPYVGLAGEAVTSTASTGATPATGWPFAGGFVVQVTPPLPRDTTLIVSAALTEQVPSGSVQYVAFLGNKKIADGLAPVVRGHVVLLSDLERARMRGGSPRSVRFEFRQGGRPTQLRGVVTDARLVLSPQPATGEKFRE